MTAYKDLSKEELLELKSGLEAQFEEVKAKGLKLDMSRGKPSADQLNLSMGMMDTLTSNSPMLLSIYFSSISNCFNINFCFAVSAYFLLYFPTLFLVHSMFSSSDIIPGTVYALRFFFLSSSAF